MAQPAIQKQGEVIRKVIKRGDTLYWVASNGCITDWQITGIGERFASVKSEHGRRYRIELGMIGFERARWQTTEIAALTRAIEDGENAAVHLKENKARLTNLTKGKKVK